MTLDDHDTRIRRLEDLATEQLGFNRDLVRLLGSIDDRLTRVETILLSINDRLGTIEIYLRPPGRNGPQRQ